MESVSPVSTLVPGLSAAVSAPLELRSESGWVSERHDRLDVEVQAPIEAAQTAKGGPVSIAGTSETIGGNDKDEGASRLVSTLATSSLPVAETGSDSPLISTPPRPVSNASGAGTARSNVPRATPAAKSSAMTETSTPAPSSSSQDDDIRPMTMAATAPSSMMLPADDSGGGGGGGDDSGGGGGGDQSGGTDGGKTIAEEGPPTLMVDDGIVGGKARAELYPPIGGNYIKSVTWTVSGAATGQSYTVGSGQTFDFTPVDHSWGGSSVGMDAVDFYWDWEPDSHTVSAHITYSDGSTADISGAVTVTAPSASFSVSYSTVGYVQPNLLQGEMSYGGTASMPDTGAVDSGTFAIIQMVDRSDTRTSLLPDDSHQTYIWDTGGSVLDNTNWTTDGTARTGILYPGTSTDLDSGDTASLFASAHDYPNLPSSYNTNTETLCSEVYMDATFTDYLVFKPEGGIWVQLQKAPSFTLNGNMTWVDSNGNPSTDPQNGHWQVTAGSTSGAGTAAGVTARGYVEWSGWANNPDRDWSPLQ